MLMARRQGVQVRGGCELVVVVVVVGSFGGILQVFSNFHSFNVTIYGVLPHGISATAEKCNSQSLFCIHVFHCVFCLAEHIAMFNW
jgi:hypothetical protein